MTKYEIDRMDPDFYTETVRSAVWDNMEMALSMKNGHSDIHKLNDESVNRDLQRLVDEDKQIAGTGGLFESEYKSLIQFAIDDRIEDISSWMQKTPKEFDSRDEYNELELTVDMREPTGRFWANGIELKEMESTGIRLVFDRDYSPDSTYGFYLKTAYPAWEYAKETGRTLTRNQVINGQFIDFKDDLQKAAFTEGKNKEDVYVTYRNDIYSDEPPYIKFIKTEKDAKYTAFMTEDRMRAYKESNISGNKRKIDIEELENGSPALLTVSGRVRQYYLNNKVKEINKEKGKDKSVKQKKQTEKDI